MSLTEYLKYVGVFSVYVCEVHVSLSSVYAHASMCAGMWLDHSLIHGGMVSP